MPFQETEYLYILTNPSIPELIKIGRTERDVEERARELSAHTGVPTEFEIFRKFPIGDSVNAERIIHLKLKDYRVSESREFFAIDPESAATVIEELLGSVEAAENESEIEDDLLSKATALARHFGRLTPSLVGSLLKISHSSAERLFELLKGRGIINDSWESTFSELPPKDCEDWRLPPYLVELLRSTPQPESASLKKSQPFSSYEVRARLPKAVLDAFKIGQKLSGVVSWIGNTLVSVDLGGAVGFVKMGDMACEPVSRPSDIVKLGDRVQVVVLGPWDAESGHLSLALIQATTQPESSSTVLDAFKIGQKCSGVVSWIGNSVVSVDLGGAVGFVKIDDMAWESVSRPSDIVKLGDRVQVVVLGPWDAESDQLSLGLKQATIQPEP